jgi:flagellar motility protein MotE (MotC chaperone)
MISRLANLAFAALLYFSFATLIAEGIMASYVWSSWQLDREKIARLVAVARGIELGEPQASAAPPPDQAAPEQPSYDQVVEARAAKDKDLELREQALASALAQFQSDQQKLAENEKRYKLDRADFETKLAATTQSATSAGQEDVRRILQTVKPKQAKEFLQGMLESKEMDEVVLLLSGMTDSKRAKILAEFKTPEETKKIEEVLRLIRKGVPEAPLAQQTLDRLRPPNTAAP